MGQVNFTMRHPDVPEGECHCSPKRGAKCLNCVHAGIVEQARLDERADIVAWLRECEARAIQRAASDAFHNAADMIESGVYRVE